MVGVDDDDEVEVEFDPGECDANPKCDGRAIAIEEVQAIRTGEMPVRIAKRKASAFFPGAFGEPRRQKFRQTQSHCETCKAAALRSRRFRLSGQLTTGLRQFSFPRAIPAKVGFRLPGTGVASAVA